MKINFSSVNPQYLIRVCDIAQEDPGVAARLLGVSPELAALLAQAPSEHLTKIAQVNLPLEAERGDAVWWSRPFKALIEENPEEVEAAPQAARPTLLS